MAFSKSKRSAIIAKMKSKSNRNGIRESMAQILEEILSSDDLGGGSINPESAFRLVRVSSATENFVKVQANVVQDEEWYVVSDDPTPDTHFSDNDNARQYVKKVLDEDGNATYVFEKPKNADVIVFYDDNHADVVSTANIALKDIYVYENNAWVKINARFTNYNAVTSTITGKWANVEGDGNTASAEGAHAEGKGNTSSGDYSHTEGNNNEASETSAHAEGSNNKALADSAHAEGRLTIAKAAGASSHGYGTVAATPRSAVFGQNAKVGDADTYFGVGFNERILDDSQKDDADDYNLHLSVKKDGSVLNKDGKAFIIADDVANEIDEKLDVFSGEGAADSLFTLYQVDGSGTTPTFAIPSIIIEASKNGKPVYVRYTDESEFFEYLNYLKGKEIHLIQSGETVSNVSITFTGFGNVNDFTAEPAKGYKSRQITGFSGTKFNKTTAQDEDIVIVPSSTTNVQYYYNKHTPIRLLVDNNSNHIRTIEQELRHADTTNLSNANTYADAEDDKHSNADRGYTDTEVQGAKTYADNKDSTLRGILETLFYERADVNTRDTTTLNSAKAYADTQDALHSTDDNAYTDSEINKVKALIDAIATGIEGHSTDADGNLVLTFNDGSSETIDVSALLSSEISEIKTSLTAIETKNTGQDTKITALEAADTALGLRIDGIGSGGGDGKHVSTATFDDGKVKLGYSDNSTGIEATIFNSPGPAAEAKGIPIIKKSSGKTIVGTATTEDIIENINSISANAANTTGLQGKVLRDGAVNTSKLHSNVQDILNLSATYGSDIQANTTKINDNASAITALPGKIKIKEKSVRVFANRSIKKTGTAEGGWQFKAANTGFLGVGIGQETPNEPDDTSTDTRHKGISIAIPKAKWNDMDKILVTASHAGQIIMTNLPPIYKEDLTAGTSVRLGTSGTARLKIDLYFEENKNQEGDADTNNNRLVIEVVHQSTVTVYIGEVFLQHLETTTS